jgi:hypothetical protein
MLIEPIGMVDGCLKRQISDYAWITGNPEVEKWVESI